ASIVERRPTRVSRELADGRVITVVNQPMAGGGWGVTHEDVTERWHAERELENTRNFLHTVIENAQATLIVKDDRDRTYALINRSDEEFYGFARERMIGKTARDVFPPDVAEKIARHDQEMLATHARQFYDEHPMQFPPGGRSIVTTTRLPIMG